MSLRGVRAFRVGAALALGVFAACYAPTLPLPPPTALVSSPDPEGFVTIVGQARQNAHVFAFNERTERGVIGVADARGDYTLRLEAAAGDVIEIWFMAGSDTSQITERTVPP